jgi:hypothetical protein
MPEHVHLLISEPKLGTPSQTLQVLKQKVSAQLATTHTNAVFWQRRFYDFNVWSSEKLEEKLSYIHNNPIERQLVSHPRDWPWSSWSNYSQNQSLIPIDRFRANGSTPAAEVLCAIAARAMNLSASSPGCRTLSLQRVRVFDLLLIPQECPRKVNPAKPARNHF